MKKVIAVLGLIAVFAASVVQAFPPLKYHWKISFFPTPCWTSGTYYPAADPTTWAPISTNPGLPPTTCNDGDGMLIELNPDCACGTGPHSVGYKWQEVSSDGGTHWSLVGGTFTYIVVPANVSAQFYTNGPSAGMTPSSVLGGCPP